MRKALIGVVVVLAVAVGAWFLRPAMFAPAAPVGTEEPPPPKGMKLATFAGGCFWCMVHPFDRIQGVTQVISGYTGGTVPSPTYKQVSNGNTGHVEAVQITYDPDQVSYEELLQVFWRNIDPFDAGGQFCDRGSSYLSAIFAHGRKQRKLAQQSKEKVATMFGRPVQTEIRDAGPFYRAEEYHQDYYKKSSLKYTFYRSGCGRDARLHELWGSRKAG